MTGEDQDSSDALNPPAATERAAGDAASPVGDAALAEPGEMLFITLSSTFTLHVDQFSYFHVAIFLFNH